MDTVYLISIELIIFLVLSLIFNVLNRCKFLQMSFLQFYLYLFCSGQSEMIIEANKSW